MELGDAGLQEQPFRTYGKPSAVSSYVAHRKALEFLAAVCRHKHGLGVLQGPTLSGKSTVIRQFVARLEDEASHAIVDCKKLDPRALFTSILKQFGYSLELTSLNELKSMLRVFAMQQAAAGQPPLLVLENCQHLDKETLAAVCELADIRARRQSALRLVLACERSIEALINEPELQCIAARLSGVHRLQPMQPLETRDYVHAKLYAAGADEPVRIFPDEVCVELHAKSSGWPGVVDRLAIIALSRATSLPVSRTHIERRQLPEEVRRGHGLSAVSSETGETGESTYSLPRLVVTRDGEIVNELEIDHARLLIGRSPHNDLAINSRFVSRHHALIVNHGSGTLLMDLNSTNGTFVNSRRISNYVMRHEDVISLGSFRVKFIHPTADHKVQGDDSGLAETVIMKTLEDMRHMLSGESTRTLPMQALNRLAAGEFD